MRRVGRSAGVTVQERLQGDRGSLRRTDVQEVLIVGPRDGRALEHVRVIVFHHVGEAPLEDGDGVVGEDLELDLLLEAADKAHMDPRQDWKNWLRQSGH